MNLDASQERAHDHAVPKASGERRIRPLNLRSCRRFTQKRMDAFAASFAPVCAELKSALTTLLHSTVSLERQGIEQQNFQLFPQSDAFLRFGRISQTGATSDVLAIGFSTRLLQAMLDRLLGAGSPSELPRTSSTTAKGSLTRLEERLAARILTQFWNAIVQCWLRPETTLTSDATAAIPPTEMTLRLVFRLSFAGASGQVALFIPVALAAEWLAKPASTSETAILKNPPWQDAEMSLFPTGSDVQEAIASTQVNVSVQFPGGKIVPPALAKWKLGDVIPLSSDTETLFQVLVHGTPKFQAEPGSYDQRKVVKIV